jgi:RsiW-degrading membrane proteinase PrsW (M82 family)
MKTKTEFNAMTDAGRNGPFWFAVLSPVLGILTGFLALLFLYR